MSAVPRELLEEFSRGNGSIFVGAGMSMGAGLPSWAELIKPLAEELEDCPPDATFLDVAQYYANVYGSNDLVKRLRRALDSLSLQPTRAHKTVVSLPVRRFFTTNLDDLLETAFRERKRPFDVVVRPAHVPFLDDTRAQLIKLHGDLRDPDSIVITAEHYESYFTSHPDVAKLLEEELQTRTVLFLGYSHKDDDLRMILTQVGARSRELRRKLFTVQFNPSALVAQDLERRGLRVISLASGADREASNEALGVWLETLAQGLHGRAQASAPVSPEALATEPVISTNNNLPSHSGDLLGRKADFARVMEGLRSRYPLITIEGFAGIGKTSLAIEVGHACAASRGQGASDAVVFEYVVWISAKDKPDQKRWLDEVLNAIASTTSFSAFTQRPLGEKKLKVDRLLRVHKILLIVDNFETIEDPDLTAWLEQIPEPSKVIITTQHVQLQQKAWAVGLRGLARAEALALLRHYAASIGLDFIKRVKRETLLALSEVTGGNPQAMKLALGLVRQGRLGLWQVINHLHGSNPDQRVDKLFEELFERSWEQLTERARQVLLATPLFVGVSSIREDALHAAAGLPPFDFDQGLSRCLEASLLEFDHDQRRFVIHPMTRAFARARLNELPDWEVAARHRCTDYFLALVKASVTREKPEPRYWNALVSDGMEALDPEWPSIHEVVKWADQEGQDEVLVDFVMLLVHYMDSRLLNSERLFWVHRAVAALRRLSRQEDEALLRIDALGWTYVEEDRLKEAQQEIHAGYRLAEKYARKERNDLLALGLAWRARVRIEENLSSRAAERIGEALKIPCRPWIKCRVNMAAGDIALKQSDSVKALKHYERAELETAKYGGEGHGYQISPRIGLAYLAAGRLDEAEQKFKQLQGIEKIAIGRLYAEYGLAMVAYKKGDIVNARALINDVKSELSRRTGSNLLLKLIKSQEAQLPGLNRGQQTAELRPGRKTARASAKGPAKKRTGSGTRRLGKGSAGP